MQRVHQEAAAAGRPRIDRLIFLFYLELRWLVIKSLISQALNARLSSFLDDIDGSHSWRGLNVVISMLHLSISTPFYTFFFFSSPTTFPFPRAVVAAFTVPNCPAVSNPSSANTESTTKSVSSSSLQRSRGIIVLRHRVMGVVGGVS